MAARLHSCASIEWWITDIAGPRALDMMQKAWGQLLAEAQFQFAPADAAQFFQRHGWHEHEFRSSQEEAQRLGRARGRSGLASLVVRLAPAKVKEELRRLSGVAVLKRVNAGACRRAFLSVSLGKGRSRRRCRPHAGGSVGSKVGTCQN